jgi:hypothetical protein
MLARRGSSAVNIETFCRPEDREVCVQVLVVKNFHFSMPSILTLGSNQPPIVQRNRLLFFVCH